MDVIDEILNEWDREAAITDAADEIIRILEDCIINDEVPSHDEIRHVIQVLINRYNPTNGH